MYKKQGYLIMQQVYKLHCYFV